MLHVISLKLNNEVNWTTSECNVKPNQQEKKSTKQLEKKSTKEKSQTLKFCVCVLFFFEV